jgi:SAM-dependent methyltransferase
LPLDDASLDLAVVADALHFLDAELIAKEIARVLAPKGALAIVTCELGKTPFMRSLVEIIEGAVPRRPRNLDQNLIQVSAITGIRFAPARQFHDETPVDGDTLERILRSISFIGPAMNPARFAAFRARVHALPGRPTWARTFTLHARFPRDGWRHRGWKHDRRNQCCFGHSRHADRGRRLHERRRSDRCGRRWREQRIRWRDSGEQHASDGWHDPDRRLHDGKYSHRRHASDRQLDPDRRKAADWRFDPDRRLRADGRFPPQGRFDRKRFKRQS